MSAAFFQSPALLATFGSMLFSALLVPLLFAPIVLLAGRKMGSRVGYIALVPVLIACVMMVKLWLASTPAGAEIVELDWIPSLGINLTFLVDGLSLLYGLVICGVGVLVCWYSSQYLTNKYRNHGHFYCYLLLFIAAMLGTVYADNLLLLFVCWEITSVTSFLLIGFLHDSEESRMGARRALLVTFMTGLSMLCGVIMLGLTAKTYSLSAIVEMGLFSAESGLGWGNCLLVLIFIGIMGKSAQFPFHFWLPGAMVAPTPVSAYLHSATMVKLGIFLTARMFPILHDLQLWFGLLTAVGFASMLMGAWMALRSNDLKAVLAYSTISQLGFLIGMYGVGGVIGVRLDFLHILSHVFYKAALFMMVGIVDHCTGTRDIRQLGGLGRRMPVSATVAVIGCAAMAGIPLTMGFISKESMLTDMLTLISMYPLAGSFILPVVLIATLLLVAVALRIVLKVFMGRFPEGLHFHAPSRAIELPGVMLAVLAVVFGVYPGLLTAPLAHLSVSGLHLEQVSKLVVWHGFTLELLISTVVLLTGCGLYYGANKTNWRLTLSPLRLDFAAPFDRSADQLVVLAKRLTRGLQADWAPAYLPIIITFLLLVVGGATVAAFLSLEGLAAQFQDVKIDPLRALVAILISTALLSIVLLRRWSAQLVSLSVGGFFLTLYFVLYRAPDLAMTQVLVESASVVMILFLLSRFPASSQLGMHRDFSLDFRRVLRLVISVGVGLLMASLVLLSDIYRHSDPIGLRLLEQSQPLAEGTNAVNTILVDFRGFDTLGEITVLLIATLGGLGLMMRYRRDRNPADPKPPPGFLFGKEKKR